MDDIDFSHDALVLMDYGSKKDILDLLMDIGILAKVRLCTKCGESMKLIERGDILDGYNWSCRSDSHTCKLSVRAGSYFTGSRLTLPTCLRLTFYWLSKCSSHQIMALTKLNQRTISEWLQYCKDVCVALCSNEFKQLGGPDMTVEVGEFNFIARKCLDKRQTEDCWVFGAVERDSNKCFFKVIGNRSKQVLLELIKETILPETTIVSDCWQAYDCLKDEDYNRLKVSRAVRLVDPGSGAHINSLKGCWASVKRSAGCRKMLARIFNTHLSEFMWRRLHKDESIHCQFKSFITGLQRCYDFLEDSN